MEYSIKEIAGIIGADAKKLHDAPVSILLTDSRRLSFPEQSLFFALQTKTNDGHNYIQGLYKLRVRNFVVSTVLPEFESMPEANFLVVKDTLKALQKLAAHHRKRFNIPVIGITGSNGKTIVKEFLYQLLHNEFNIVRSPRSYNSQLGVPLSVWQMSDKNTLGIFEAGISQPDEMERLQPIIAPTIGVVTNIGEAHQENFISSTQKCLEKLTLFNDCEAIIYDGDDAFISNCIESACLSHKAITWSRTDSEAPLYIESIKKLESETIIRCTLLGFDRTYTIPFTDDASIENVIHCMAVMLYLKPTSVNDVEKFKRLEPVAMRLDVKQGINNCLLINDTYNSDINSLDIALDFQQSRRVEKDLKCTLILSDILQSGTLPKSLYKKVADLVRRKKIDRIIGIGRGRTVYNTSLLLPLSDDSPERIFVPLVGNAGHHYSPLQTSAIVNRFATQFRADGFYINSSVIDTKSMSLLQKEELNELSKYWNSLDAAVIGIGDKDETASIYVDNDIPLEFIDKEAFSSAKGEIFGQPFNEDGEIAWRQTQVNRYTYVGIPLQKLKEIPNVICIACGQNKTEPLITAARLGYYKTLIIDKLTAEKMLMSEED